MTSPYDGMTAVLYMRVSTDDKEQRISVQDMELTKWCRDHNVSILKKFSDEGISGATADRPGYQQMIGYVLQTKPSIILAMNQDRIARSTDIMESLLNLLKKNETKTVIRYSHSSAEPERGAGKFINYFETQKGQEVNELQSIKIKSGMKEAQINGTRSGKPIGRPKVHFDNRLIMQCADLGLSYRKTAGVLGKKESTLRQYIKDSGLDAEYRDRVAKHNAQKGLCAERLVCLNTNEEKTENQEMREKEVLSAQANNLSAQQNNNSEEEQCRNV